MFANLLVLMSSFLVFNNNGPTYTVQNKNEQFQLRRYDPWVVAQTVVKSNHEDAGNQAFHILAGYIFGKNDQNTKIQMTAPVTQQQIGEGQYLIQFYMPKNWTLETLPKPNDSRVQLTMLPEREIFAERYVGGWSDSLYAKELKNLNAEVAKEHISIKKSNPIWARYNSPMAPSFLRTNEIMYEVERSNQI